MQLRFLSLRSSALCLSFSMLAMAGCPDGGGDTDTDSGTGTMTSNPMTMGTTGPDPTMTGPSSDPMTDPTAGMTDPTGGMTDPTSGMTDPTGGPSGDGQFCQEACAADGDCTIQGMDMGYKCVDSRCTLEGGGCDNDQQCIAQGSGWSFQPCMAASDCVVPGAVCVDLGDGTGGCATPPSDVLPCSTLMQEEVMVTTTDGEMATVCGNTDFVCKDNLCQNPCEDDMECANFAGHPSCNVGTGTCECTSDTDCSGSGIEGYAACVNGRCGCAADTDCTGDFGDKCYEGSCGCSDVAVCQGATVFGGTMKVCEGF